MVRGLLCVALLLVTAAAHADTWPDKEWAKGARCTECLCFSTP